MSLVMREFDLRERLIGVGIFFFSELMVLVFDKVEGQFEVLIDFSNIADKLRLKLNDEIWLILFEFSI